MKKLVQSLFILLLFASSVIAQERTINGIVTAKEDGIPLPGVSVKIKGASIGTSIAVKRKYSAHENSRGAILDFSFIDYTAQSKSVGAGSFINAAMENDPNTLSGILVIGYGVPNRRDFTRFVSGTKVNGLKNKPVQSFLQDLTGQAAAVSMQPNGLLNNPQVIRFRGASSISLSSFPLIIVDGTPFQAGDASANTAANNPLGDISLLPYKSFSLPPAL